MLAIFVTPLFDPDPPEVDPEESDTEAPAAEIGYVALSKSATMHTAAPDATAPG